MIDTIRCRGIILDGTKLLTVRLRPEDNWYCLPGGKLDNYETMDECTGREMIEEFGIVPIIGKLCCIQELIFMGGKHGIEFFYEIENVSDYKNIDLSSASHGFEITELRWIDIASTDIDFYPKKLLPWLVNKDYEKEIGRFVEINDG